jgi:p-aminobenzoyl-glutamate transporter AbgT
MNIEKLLSFIVVIALFSACSSVRSFKLVDVEHQKTHEINAGTNVYSIFETDHLITPTIATPQEQKEEQEVLVSDSHDSPLSQIKRKVIQTKQIAVQTVQKTSSKLNKHIGKRKTHPSDNFWMDLIKDFFLFMLIGIIVVGIIAAMIAYGNPVVQMIGKVLAIMIIVIGFFALLFS